MDNVSKIVKELNEKGWSRYKSVQADENPDTFLMFSVWKYFGEKNLWLDYDWQKGVYYFYMWNARKELPSIKRSVDVYNVRKTVYKNYGKLIPLARKIAKSIDKKQSYFTKNLNEIQIIKNDYELILGLIDLFVSDLSWDHWNSNVGLMINGDHSYFIIGEDKFIESKLTRLGYSRMLTYDEYGDGPFVEFIDADLQYNTINWEQRKLEIENFIRDEIQNELGDCIYISDYDNKSKLWTYNLDLGEEYKDSIRKFVKEWNKSKPYKILCKMEIGKVGIEYQLIFKNRFKQKFGKILQEKNIQK